MLPCNWIHGGVIKNYRNRLYAIRTVLGWSVNGPLNGHSDTMEAEFPSAMVKRITVSKLEEMLTIQYYHDFNDKRRHGVFWKLTVILQNWWTDITA